MLVYSAGCMNYYHETNTFEEKAIKWRLKLKDELSKLNIDLFDPTLNFNSNLIYSNRSVKLQNQYYLDKSDILIVNLENLDKSPGTLWEIYYANFKNKIILAFGNNKWYNSPHIKDSITEKFNDIDEVIEYIKNLYLQ